MVYEIYPRSYQDSTGDGIGDLNGITSRLGYLQKLGVDAIWIAPMYPSPQVDFGYDISNYESVDPQYGTLADMDRLIAERPQTRRPRHARHGAQPHLRQAPMVYRCIQLPCQPQAQLVRLERWHPRRFPCVTAYQKRFEHEGPNGKVVPPNNWVSGFGGSAWEWVPAVHQFYYTSSTSSSPTSTGVIQPSKKAMFGAMQFWLDRGVAGFRLDAIPSLFEGPNAA